MDFQGALQGMGLEAPLAYLLHFCMAAFDDMWLPFAIQLVIIAFVVIIRLLTFAFILLARIFAFALARFFFLRRYRILDDQDACVLGDVY